MFKYLFITYVEIQFYVDMQNLKMREKVLNFETPEYEIIFT